jgi:hypothetical protein
LLKILIIGLALAIQAVNFAAVGVGIGLFNSMDNLSPAINGMPTNLQNNIGYITYVIVGSAISVLLYAYLLFVKLGDQPRNHRSDLIALFLAFGFQHAVATVLAVLIQNTKTQYSYDQSVLSSLQAAGVTGTLVNNYSN